MNTSKSSGVFLFFLFLFFIQLTSAGSLTGFGERSIACLNKDADDIEVRVAEVLAAETKQLMQENKLTTMLVPFPNCLRIGTEIKLFLDKVDVGFIGRAFLSSMDIQTVDAIKKNSQIPFSQKTLEKFFQTQNSYEYAVLQFKITEKVQETVLTAANDRLPTCFTIYGDWESVIFEYQEGAAAASDIQKGKVNAEIWNGTFNCYKIGVPAAIYVEKPNQAKPPEPDSDSTRERAEDKNYGVIVPKELHLIHYANLTEKHASLLKENLADLKKRLAEKRDLDGGFTTMVVFDYLEKAPKLLEDDSTRRDHDANSVNYHNPGQRR